jgi:hypothetical protein
MTSRMLASTRGKYFTAASVKRLDWLSAVIFYHDRHRAEKAPLGSPPPTLIRFMTVFRLCLPASISTGPAADSRPLELLVMHWIIRAPFNIQWSMGTGQQYRIYLERYNFSRPVMSLPAKAKSVCGGRHCRMQLALATEKRYAAIQGDHLWSATYNMVIADLKGFCLLNRDENTDQHNGITKRYKIR